MPYVKSLRFRDDLTASEQEKVLSCLKAESGLIKGLNDKYSEAKATHLFMLHCIKKYSLERYCEESKILLDESEIDKGWEWSWGGCFLVFLYCFGLYKALAVIVTDLAAAGVGGFASLIIGIAFLWFLLIACYNLYTWFKSEGKLADILRQIPWQGLTYVLAGIIIIIVVSLEVIHQLTGDAVYSIISEFREFGNVVAENRRFIVFIVVLSLIFGGIKNSLIRPNRSWKWHRVLYSKEIVVSYVKAVFVAPIAEELVFRLFFFNLLVLLFLQTSGLSEVPVVHIQPFAWIPVLNGFD